MFKDKNRKEEQQHEEQVVTRQKISAEETFTLAKDVFDIRCFVKNVYSNRALIARRMNLLSLTVSLILTLLYTTYIFVTRLFNKLNLSLEIVLFSLLGAYAALFIAVIVVSIIYGKTSTKQVRKIKTTLRVFKIAVRMVSVALSIVAIILSCSDGKYTASHAAVDVIIIVFSVIMIVTQSIPLLFGGTGRFVRWLLSPVKIKYRFSKVVLEWYELAVSGTAKGGAAKKVSSKYFDEIGTLIDVYLIPALGKKYVNAIKPASLLHVVESAEAADRPVLEGILKSVFSYAAECGYVNIDPCRDLHFSGSVEEQEKTEKTSIKQRLLGAGLKIGKSVLDKYIASTSDDDKD